MPEQPSVERREWTQIAIPSRVDAVPPAVDALQQHLAARGAANEALDAIRLAVTEAITNAVAHGQGAHVRLDWSWHGDWLDVKVSEPGHFEAPPDWDQLPADDLQESGRGGFLIAQLMDGATHTNRDGVHTVHLRKRLGAAQTGAATIDELDRTLAAMTEDLGASYEVLSALFRLAEALATSEDLAAFAARALQLRQLVDADAMLIRLSNEGNGLQTLAGAGSLDAPPLLPPDAAALEAEVFRSGTERTIDDRTRLPPGDPLRGEAGSAFVCPIDFQGRKLGVCAIVRNRPGAFFTAGQLSLARTLNEFLGIACASAELEAQRRAELQARRELEIAAQIQQSLLPTRFPDRGRWRLHGHCVNAQEVGGDFFDVIEVPGGILLVIADVMGKGVPAALYALVLRTAIRSRLDLAADPGRLLTAINAQIAPDLEPHGMFITAQAVFLADHRIDYANAGHCPLLLLAHERGLRVLEEGGMPLGVAGREEFASHRVDFERGQVLLMLTDGLLETTNPQGAMLGLGGLALIAGTLTGQTAPDLCRNLLAAVDAFGGGRAAEDDRTLLVVEARG